MIQSLKFRAQDLGISTGGKNFQAIKYTGVVNNAPPGKYYGFITKDNTAETVYVHFKDVIEQNQQLVIGEHVEFEIQDSSKGPQAIRVKRVLETNKTILHQEGMDEAIEKLVLKFREVSQREITFLLLGKTGVGKSSTVNTLIGKQVADVGDYEPITFTVKYYHSQIQGINFSIIDTPGLCDDLPERSKDEIYLNEIKAKVANIDCVWFTTQLSETRLRPDEKRAISAITKTFGRQIWERSVIVFTFADLIHPTIYSDVLQKRTNRLTDAIAEYIGADIAMNIPSVAVSNIFDTTPDGQPWLGELYTKVFTRISNQGALPFFLATVGRLTESKGQVPQTAIELQKPLPAKEKTPRNEAGRLPKQIPLNDKQQKVIAKHVSKLPEFDPQWTGSLIGVGINVGMASGSLPGFVISVVSGAVAGAVIDGVRWFGEVFKRAKR